MPASKYTSTSFMLRELLAIHVQCVHALAIIGAEKREGLFFFKEVLSSHKMDVHLLTKH